MEGSSSAQPSRVAEEPLAPTSTRLAKVDRVIFACAHNAGRSQMAAAFFNLLADPNRAIALSAGTRPAPHVHPVVVTAMRELGIDLADARPQLLTSTFMHDVTLLVTMGCGEECPLIPGIEILDWPLADPKDRPLADVRLIRDEIRRRVVDLVHARGWATTPPTIN